ncbi:acetyl esterase/lipase [Keratinibaculum paraultunense]|uniref:Acetyl esterase/lipase n=1 Tax=Keratinibaculum paraultunense TaxID=1278232 RepID=A0A4R3KXJ9_9FIRM|nr:alpha/beta hydrolase [Keratinibaculum paraultunense]QQY78967.1 alpha/beta hydrolase [Keratinibaculum paraultunense]TCS90587.1 acetyl esterase/lipase [Keratinibaculum paraultunense]
MNKLKEKLKMSYFIANKIYLFLIFILLSIEDLTLGLYYFLLSIIIYVWKIFTSKVPIEVDGEFRNKTYVYKKANNKELKLDIWYPNSNKNKYPLVFFCHGGGWISGFRNQPNNISWCKYLASKGLAVVSIDYRYGYKNTMEDILSDYNDALNYVKNNSEMLSIDKNNIVLMGLSAGGHLSLLYSTYYTYIEDKDKMSGIKAVVAYYAPSDLKDIFVSENKSIFAKFATKQTLKGSPTKKEEIYDYYSPINWVSPNMVPTLLAHGKLDVTVPFKSSVNFAKKLKKYNIKYAFLVHKKGGHSFDTKLKDITTINILERTIRYIKKSLNYK